MAILPLNFSCRAKVFNRFSTNSILSPTARGYQSQTCLYKFLVLNSQTRGPPNSGIETIVAAFDFPVSVAGPQNSKNCRKVEDVMEARNEELNGVLMFVAGSLLGAGLALLLAPQSGRKTRRDIVHLGKMATKQSEQIQLEIRHAVDNLVEDISEKMQEGIDRGRGWTENTTQAVLQALESGKDHIRKELENVLSRSA